MAGLTIVTDVASEPLTVSEVKDYIRVDDNIDDTVITNMIKSARLWVENYTNRSLLNRTLKYSIDYIDEVEQPLWEGVRVGPDMTMRRRYLQLPRPPVVSVSSVKYFSDDDTETVFASSKYYVDNAREPARIVLRNGETWPTALRVANAIEVTYVSGYGANRTDVPEALIQGIMQTIAFYYENRGDVYDRPQNFAPKTLKLLLDPYKVMSFSTNPFVDSVSGYAS